jgi:hypothetical protein
MGGPLGLFLSPTPPMQSPRLRSQLALGHRGEMRESPWLFPHVLQCLHELAGLPMAKLKFYVTIIIELG